MQYTTSVYRHPSGMECLFITHPASTRAFAHLILATGSEHDPDDFLGISHMLEHAVFLESQLDSYLATFSGENNAETRDSSTHFQFDCHHKGLEKGLDILFEQTFKPKFSAEGVAKELSVVGSEYESAFAQEDWKLAYLLYQHISNKTHPCSRFTFGTPKTLADKEHKTLLQAIIEHHKKYYTANGAKLIVLSPFTAAEMQKMVPANLPSFAPPALNKTPLLNPEHCGLIRNTGQATSSLSFYIPLQVSDVRILRVISHLLSMQHKGSFLHHFKKYILNHECDEQTICAAQKEIYFSIDIKNDTDPQLLIDGFYGYLHFLANADLTKVYTALQKLSQINHTYSDMDAEDIVLVAVDNAEHFALNEVFSAQILPNLPIQQTLKNINHTNTRVLYSNPDISCAKTESFTNIAYEIEKLKIHTKLYPYQLPAIPNMPEDFSYHISPAQSWMIPSKDFIPEVRTHYILQCGAPRQHKIVLIHALEELLTNHTTEMEFRGFTVSFDIHPQGFLFSCSGFRDNYLVNFEWILGILRGKLPLEKSYDLILDSLQDEPYEELDERLNTLSERLALGISINPTMSEYSAPAEYYETLQKEIFSTAHRILSVGNVNADLYNQIVKHFTIVPLPPLTTQATIRSGAVASIAAGVVLSAPFKDTPHNHVALMILATLLKDLFFAQLRTEQTWGYHAQLVYHSFEHQPALKLLLHTNSHDVLGGFCAVMDFFKQPLDTKMFEEHKRQLLDTLKEKPTTLTEFEEEYWDSFYIGVPNLLEAKIAALEGLNASYLTQIYSTLKDPAKWIKGSVYAKEDL